MTAELAYGVLCPDCLEIVCECTTESAPETRHVDEEGWMTTEFTKPGRLRALTVDGGFAIDFSSTSLLVEKRYRLLARRTDHSTVEVQLLSDSGTMVGHWMIPAYQSGHDIEPHVTITWEE